ncbi:g10601 [Coccomyxa elongata]
MGLPELGTYASPGGHRGKKYGDDFMTRPSEFDSTLEKLSPHLLARLSLHPGVGAVNGRGFDTPGTPASSSSGTGTPSETASGGGQRSGSGQGRRRGNRSWSQQAQLPNVAGPPGLTPPPRNSAGSLPSPPYSADVDRAFQQRPNHAPKSFDRPRSAASTPESTPYRQRQARPSETTPSGSPTRYHRDAPSSHPRASRPQQRPRSGSGQPRKLALTPDPGAAAARLLRAGLRTEPRARSEAGSEEGAQLQTGRFPPPRPVSAGGRSISSEASESVHSVKAGATYSNQEEENTAAGAGKKSALSPRLEIHASAGHSTADAPEVKQPAAAPLPEVEWPAAQEERERRERLEMLKTEKEKADDLAQQMAKQAEQLVAERAEMAARNAALARENAQLMARLEFLEEAAAAAAAPDGCGDGASAEELGFLHQALQRVEEEKALLEWQLHQQGGTGAQLPSDFSDDVYYGM